MHVFFLTFCRDLFMAFLAIKFELHLSSYQDTYHRYLYALPMTQKGWLVQGGEASAVPCCVYTGFVTNVTCITETL